MSTDLRFRHVCLVALPTGGTDILYDGPIMPNPRNWRRVGTGDHVYYWRQR